MYLYLETNFETGFETQSGMSTMKKKVRKFVSRQELNKFSHFIFFKF